MKKIKLINMQPTKTKHSNVSRQAAIISACLIMSVAAGCGSAKTSQNTYNATQPTSSTTTSATTTAATTVAPTTTAAPVNKLFGQGTYDYSVNGTALTITYSDTAVSDATHYYADYTWNAVTPSDYTYNKYASAHISFYDATHGTFIAGLGSGAGSSYYAIYYTCDGGQSWVKFDTNYQKSNTNACITFTDENTLTIIDTGAGLSTPHYDVFNMQPTGITQTTSRSKIGDGLDMVKSFSITSVSSKEINCSYTLDSDSSVGTCTITP